jgi:hypothetical protein
MSVFVLDVGLTNIKDLGDRLARIPTWSREIRGDLELGEHCQTAYCDRQSRLLCRVSTEYTVLGGEKESSRGRKHGNDFNHVELTELGEILLAGVGRKN